ncbi:MAG: DUF2339 domain-containing protein [Planctomycetota bacterium]|nr:DUF2339 domain-containing protein [Planctomycetota bacterium]
MDRVDERMARLEARLARLEILVERMRTDTPGASDAPALDMEDQVAMLLAGERPPPIPQPATPLAAPPVFGSTTAAEGSTSITPHSAPPTSFPPTSTGRGSPALPGFLANASDEAPIDVSARRQAWEAHLAARRKSAASQAGNQAADGEHQAKPGATRRGIDLESMIGGHWFAIAGGAVLLLGLVFFFQFAVREGWIQKIPPWGRVGMGWTLGLALVGAGEGLRKKINAWAAAGLTGAGVGGLFIATLVGYMMFELYSAPAAITLIACSAAIGVVQALRLNLVAVAHLSLVGAILAPLLLRTEHPDVNPLSIYFFAALTTALLLAAIRAGTFATLRWSVPLLVAIVGYACAMHATAHAWVWATFAGAVGVAVHLETAISAVRRDRAESPDGTMHDAPTDEAEAKRPRATTLNDAPESVLLFIITLWSIGLATLLVTRMVPHLQWMPAAAGCAAALLGAFALAGNVTTLRQQPRSRGELVGAIELMLAAGLLITTVALAFSDAAQLIAWLALGGAALIGGQAIDWKPLRMFGYVLAGIASGRLFLYEPFAGSLLTGGIEVGGLWLTQWAAVSAGAAALWLIAGATTPRRENGRLAASGVAMGQLGVLHLTLLVCHTDGSLKSMMVYWIALAAALLGARVPLRAIASEVSAFVVACVALIAWISVYLATGWDRSGAPMLLHQGLLPSFVIAALLVLSVLATLARTARESRPAWAPTLAYSLASLVVLTSTSLEVARSAALLTADSTMRTAAVSIWWGVCAIGMLIGGTIWRQAFVRRAGLGLLALATAKAIIIDTSELTAGWRAINVLVLGAIMLGVGVAYARAGKYLARAVDGDAAKPDEGATRDPEGEPSEPKTEYGEEGSEPPRQA